jgi:predicted TIM-barrel fold metal-dependent hydrolase
MSDHSASELRARLGHPVVDSDGHTIEFTPALYAAIEQVAGPRVRERFETTLNDAVLGWYAQGSEERRTRRPLRPAWWATPARNTLDRATATLPRLLHERMDELGLDFTVLYPSIGLLLFSQDDEELRRAACRGTNVLNAEVHRPYADRMTPAAAIPMHTPAEAIDELRFAVRELGLKVAMFAGHVRRPGSDGGPAWVDTLGIDSAHDYDPVWRECAALGIAPTFHSSGAGWASRASPTSYVYNHLGQFASAGEATCRSLFLAGVTRRFPDLRFAFLEGGVGWACGLYADLLGHWEKRNRSALADLDPHAIDAARLRELFERYAEPAYRGRLERLLGTIGLHVTDEPPELIDEFARCAIRSPADLRELFVPRFFFGCEADDPLNAWAFDARANPLGAKLGAVFSSDIGHWDVPDMAAVLGEAWELVERGLIAPEDFRAFVFDHPLELWTAANPAFFEGTRVEKAAREWLSVRALRTRQEGDAWPRTP